LGCKKQNSNQWAKICNKEAFGSMKI